MAPGDYFPIDLPAPTYPCGHLIGAGIHQTRDEVDACTREGMAAARALVAGFSASLLPGWRGGKIIVTSPTPETAQIEVVRFRAGFSEDPPAVTITVRPGASLAAEWVYERFGRYPGVYGRFTSFSEALANALISAGGDLQELLGDDQ